MTTRFICPHCHTAVDPHAMERAWSDLAEYRICPTCDEPIFFAARAAPKLPLWLRRNAAAGGERAPVHARRA